VHLVERGRVFRIGFDGGDAFEQALRDRLVHRAGGELAQAFHQPASQFIAARATAGDTDHTELVRQQIARRKIIERRDNQPMRQTRSSSARYTSSSE